MEDKSDQDTPKQSTGEPQKPDRIDSLIRVLPVLAVIVGAVWTLVLYFDSVRQKNNLENKQLELQLKSGEITRAKLQNEVAIQEAQIRLDALSRRERQISLSAKRVGQSKDDFLYEIDFSAVLKNTAKVPTVLNYNMVGVYKGILNKDFKEFAIATPPTWVDASPKYTGAIRWTRLHCFFNKLDACTIDAAKIKEKYIPDVIDRTGTGKIVPGDSMKLGYSFYLKAKPEDWIAVVYHGSFDKGTDDDDNKTYIEWNQLRQLENDSKKPKQKVDFASVDAR